MKTLTGTIVSEAKDTLVVEVTWKTRHPLYKKTLVKSQKFLVGPGTLQHASAGDIVQIRETRPISKRKHFIVHKIIKISLKKEEKVNGTA